MGGPCRSVLIHEAESGVRDEWPGFLETPGDTPCGNPGGPLKTLAEPP